MPLLRTLRSTALSVLDDPRFRHCPVCLDELCRLELEISVVSPLSPAGHPLDFEPVRHGIYLTIGRRSGCFLPQVAQETGWGHEQLLDRLCTEKMGLAASAWRNGEACLSVFTTVTIGPEPFIPTGSM
jgi:AMMECR1 domain-containing protein